MAPVIRNDCENGTAEAARKIRKRGTLLSREELEAIGRRANAKIGRDYLAALTPLGREAGGGNSGLVLVAMGEGLTEQLRDELAG